MEQETDRPNTLRGGKSIALALGECVRSNPLNQTASMIVRDLHPAGGSFCCLQSLLPGGKLEKALLNFSITPGKVGLGGVAKLVFRSVILANKYRKVTNPRWINQEQQAFR